MTKRRDQFTLHRVSPTKESQEILEDLVKILLLFIIIF